MAHHISYDQILELTGLGGTQIFVAFAAGMTVASDGAVTMILAVLSSWVQCEFRVQILHTTLISAVLFLSGIVGTYVLGVMCDLYGRKQVLILACAMITVLNTLVALSPTYSWVLFLRFAIGFFVGSFAAVYTIDFLPVRHRRLIILVRAFWSIGTLFSLGFAYWTTKFISWRSAMLFISGVPLFSTVCMLQAPESPKFLLVHNKIEEARSVIRRVLGHSRDYSPFSAFISIPPEQDTSKIASLMTLFNEEYISRTLTQCLLRFVTGLCYFSMAILSFNYFRTGLSHPNSLETKRCSACVPVGTNHYILQVYFAVGDLLGGTLAFLAVNRIGGRMTLILTYGLSSLLTVTLLDPSRGLFGKIVVFVLKIVINGNFCTLSQFTVEVYPTAVRGIQCGLGCCFLYLGGMVSPFLSELLFVTNPELTIILLSVSQALACISVLILKIDMKGKLLQDT